jgi:prepilin-type N-terminal cleavage/methylation domain-containing protein
MAMEGNQMKRRVREAGFTLIEVAVAIVVLTIGVVGIASVFVSGLKVMGSSQNTFVAKEKAEEAIESVFAGRDDQNLKWAMILNVKGASGSDGGVFLDGPLNINDPGPDGLVNTADDGAMEYIVEPGPDGVYGTADDVQVPLAQFCREIQIRNSPTIPNLRTLTVIITSLPPAGCAGSSGEWQPGVIGPANGIVLYKITTYISSYS